MLFKIKKCTENTLESIKTQKIPKQRNKISLIIWFHVIEIIEIEFIADTVSFSNTGREKKNQCLQSSHSTNCRRYAIPSAHLGAPRRHNLSERIRKTLAATMTRIYIYMHIPVRSINRLTIGFLVFSSRIRTQVVRNTCCVRRVARA
jgi:hypothetical protein